jgi:LPS sulfotransferase NodH
MHYGLRHRLKRLYVETTHFSPIPRRAQYFVIVSQERTGSTLLSTLLSFHPALLTDMDIFYTPETWPARRRTGRRLFTTRPVRGFKFKGTHAPLQNSAHATREFLQRRCDAGLRIIRLQRHDVLRQAISSYMVGTRNELHAWKNREERTASGRASVVVDVEEIYERMLYFARLGRFQDRMLKGIPHLSLSYESELLDSDLHQSASNRVFEHLGLTSYPVETRLRKLTTDDLSGSVSNVDELAERLKGTRFASYLPAAVTSSPPAPPQC